MGEAINVFCPSTFPRYGAPTSFDVKRRKWRYGFTLTLTAAGIADANLNKNLMWHDTGVQKLYSTLTEPPPNNSLKVYDVACTVLDNNFLPKQNKQYERHLFGSHLRSKIKFYQNMLFHHVV